MDESFETIINSYLDHNIGIAEDFLSQTLAGHLKQNLLLLKKNNLMAAAGTGNSEKTQHDTKVRGDSIYWLDRKNEDAHENEFLDQMDSFVQYLNNSCYTGITAYEFHYSIYEKGTFYTKHLDQFQSNQSRKFSMISYLNTDWKEEDGGQLYIHQAAQSQSIAPTSGKTVFFKSDELEHEVLLTNETRMSITGWLKNT